MNVDCVECAASIAPDKATMTARGWQCAPCVTRAEIDVLHGADQGVGHLSIDEMRARADNAKKAAVAAGVAAIALTLAGVFVLTNSRWKFRAIAAAFAGFGVVLWEVGVWRRARRTAAMMEARGQASRSTGR